MTNKRVGSCSLVFDSKPRIISSAAIVGDVEGAGPLGAYFDMVLTDDTWNEDSWEKAERKMFENAVRIACDKVKYNPESIDCLLGGDLLNQIISANFAARELKSPYLGLYGACSTMAESLLVGSILTDGGYADIVACAASSHFSTAERQYRFPLELGNQSTPSSQRTVTGAGSVIIAQSENEICKKAQLKNIVISGATIGKVIDMGITDANNMGAAMAPAAASTLCTLLFDTNTAPTDYDMIVTGDLGLLGSELFFELCKKQGVDIKNKHADCGNMIFYQRQNVDCGGSGCGCSAVTLCGYLLKRIEAGDMQKIIFIATGALLSPTTTLQGETIPAIAHAVIIERSKSV